jgi:autotransporter strand-loop-strand O-heptosyltransferase
MAHVEQRNFCIKVKEKFPDFFKNKKVLDIGSLDINGSNRDLFEDCDYIGLDVGEGRNVDVVSVGHLYDAPDNFFDTIISTEVFEHDMFYEETVKNIIRMLKPGGLFVFTCAAPGRPEHGTRRCGEECAPLLIQISEEWADYYKILDNHDFEKISNFKKTFPDGYFELNNLYLEIPSDLYFYGIKGGEKYYINNIVTEYNKPEFNEHIFVIDSWPDNEKKENDLINLIKKLKSFNIQILLVGHYPIKEEIQKMVDYYIFDKNNPLLFSNEFNSFDVGSGRWAETSEYRVDISMIFHHDYAIWETMRTAFNFCKFLNKKYIHFLEYDNNPNVFQYKQCFIEQITNHDAIIYEYSLDSAKKLNPYCATFIFSIKTDVALKLISQINSKVEYFTKKPKGWQLERVFLEKLTNVTNNIKLSEYIANENELNTQAVWNRDGIIKNGAIFQSYLAVDYKGQLYLELTSGFDNKKAEKDYLIEIEYSSIRKFVTLKKDNMVIIPLGEYRVGSYVKLYYEGVLVFNEFLYKSAKKFKEVNSIILKNELLPEPKININFIDGAFVEILDDIDSKYDIEFIDKQTNRVIFGTTIKNNCWAKCNKKYFIDWRIKIKSQYGKEYTYDLDLKNQNVLISFESKSLGDTLAWMSYVEAFGIKHGCNIICSTFHNDLFVNQYKNIKFIKPGNTASNIIALYRLGVFYNGDNFNEEYHLTDPKKEPLLKIASDILELEYKELKPSLPVLSTKKEKRVCIATHSTAQCKYWNNPTGWQEVVDFLIENGYEVRLLSIEEDGYMGNKNPIGVTQQPKGEITDVLKTLQESEFFIGISSGLSWLAWASGIKTILISGFTDKYLEPLNDIYRVINKEVCHGCWHTHKFDAGDWNWCPIHKGTSREFECSKSITADQVINLIKNENLCSNRVIS